MAYATPRFCIDCSIPVGKYKVRCEEHRRLKRRAETQAWRDADPERARESVRRSDAKRNGTPRRRASSRKSQLKQLYGMTPEEWQRKFDEQNGLCAICLLAPAQCVDHRHSDDKVRGLLCHRCNKGIGLLGDSAATAHSATKYLLKHLEGIWYTDEVRGFLCDRCNTGLGLLGDDSAGTHSGLRYLALHEHAFLGAGL